MATTSIFAKRLKEARNRAKLSQKALGIEAGIDPFSASARMNQYEKGKHTPDYVTSKRLAEVLGVPVPYFYADNEDFAELILLIDSLPTKERRQLLTQLRKAAGENT